MTTCQCTDLEVAATLWWTTRRPAGWTEEQHLEDPAALSGIVQDLERPIPSVQEMFLCYAIADAIRARRGLAPLRLPRSEEPTP